jgi:ATP adenylyltransferase
MLAWFLVQAIHPRAAVFFRLPLGQKVEYAPTPMPERGWPWQAAAETTRQALRSGALEPIPSMSELVADGEFTFLLRTVGNFGKKPQLGRPAPASAPNPFLPPDPALTVANVGPRHVAVLNKFPIVPDHLLLVTRQFEPQQSLLTPLDFGAAWACLSGGETLVFYNSGRLSGASQPHKHLQAVRLPLGSEGPRIPFEPLFEPCGSDGQIGPVTRLPFLHGFVRLNPTWTHEEAVRSSYALYHQLLSALELAPRERDREQPAAYNLLLTREWLLMVPRAREGIGSISINALGFCGALLVRDEIERDQLIRLGPMTALTQTGILRPTPSSQPGEPVLGYHA